MNRANLVYLLMIVVLIGGLWAVLAAGERLSAPEDLDGRWVAVDGVPSTWRGLTVEQSGRYFDLAFDGNPKASTIGVTMVGHPTAGPLELGRGPWHVTVDAPVTDGARTFHVDGPTPGTFTGRRETPATRPAAR